MTLELFIQLLNQLSSTQWQSIVEGANINLVNDRKLVINTKNTNSIVESKDIPAAQYKDVKAYVIRNASELLQQYYISHPLSQAGFNQQVNALFTDFGIDKFIANDGQTAVLTLFVEGSKVVAENADNPRHRYGVYFTPDENNKDDFPDQAISWLDSGEAYDTYLGMNVCRYNC